MDRRLRAVSLLTASLALLATTVNASGIPDCNLSVIPNVISSPNGTMATTFTIVSTSGPINGATVELRYTVNGNSGACWCPGQVHPTISGTTNSSGQVTFNVSGGGCLNPATISGGVAIEVYVNNIPCKQIGQVSPDAVLSTLPDCSVTLSDAVNFTTPLASGAYSFCHDLNSDLAVGLTDAVLFTAPAAGAASCDN
jgi:hypothetical protein